MKPLDVLDISVSHALSVSSFVAWLSPFSISVFRHLDLPQYLRVGQVHLFVGLQRVYHEVPVFRVLCRLRFGCATYRLSAFVVFCLAPSCSKYHEVPVFRVLCRLRFGCATHRLFACVVFFLTPSCSLPCFCRSSGPAVVDVAVKTPHLPGSQG